MQTLISNISDFAIEFLNNANYSTLIGVVFTGIFAYGTAKYTSTRPQKIKVKQDQLLNVYLPLHRLLDEMPPEPSQSQALEYHEKISSILDHYYELAFPQLHTLNSNLKQSLANKKGYASIIRAMKHQIDIDYELLKKSLGYPSESFIGLFVRMTFNQKLKLVFHWIDAVWILIPSGIWFAASSYLSLPVPISLLCMFIFLFISALFFGYISQKIRSLED